VTDYFQKFKSLSDTLAVVGQHLNEFESLSFVLAGLGTDFDSIVTTISTCGDTMPLEDLYSHLLIHEQRIEHQSTTTEPFFFPLPMLPSIVVVAVVVIVVFLHFFLHHKVTPPGLSVKFVTNQAILLSPVITGSTMLINVSLLSRCKLILQLRLVQVI
jgi:hypothetical protein